MPKAIEVANELRRIADSLSAQPDAEVQKAWVTFYCASKELFLSTFRALPRPLAKKYDTDGDSWDRVHLEHRGTGVDLDCSVYRSTICELVEPAKEAVYRCEPLLSDEEEAQVSA